MSDFVVYKLHALEKIDLDDIMTFIRPFIKDYIWHYNPFHLVQSAPDIFQGKTVFEEAIADEWKIVDLLYKISNKFQVIIQVSDSDGEFLLIEAADVLPKWLDPSSAKGRIFIYRNELHIIPQEIQNPTMETCIKTILSLVETKASRKVQDVLYSRLKQNFTCQIHRLQVIVPHLVGHLLYYDPQLISHCVHAFYNRDPDAIKLCQSMNMFKPLPENMVKMTASMTRMMYAQLESARFPVMKPFNMPSTNSPDYNAADLGMKIACGFEMLYRDPYWNQQLEKVQSIAEYNFSVDQGWGKYQKRLEKLGYYRQELKDSALYQVLEKQAKEQYLADKLNDNEYMNTKNPVHVIKDILKLSLVSKDDLPQGPSDSDEWLTLDQKAEQDLASKFASADLQDSDSDLDNVEEEELKNMSQWVDGFNDFIKVKSSVSGALFPGETDDVEDGDFDATQFFKTIINSVGIRKSDVKDLGDKIDLLFDTDSDLSDAVEDIEETGSDDESFDEYVQSMDHELKNSKVGSSLPEGPESDEIKIDKNLIQNLLDSFSAQDGLPGPVSNIMLSLDTPLPKKQ